MLEKIQKLEQETEKLKNDLNELINEQQLQPNSELIKHKINALKNQLPNNYEVFYSVVWYSKDENNNRIKK